MTMTHLPLPDWIQRARSLLVSKEDYIECAITVALELTNRLCLGVGTNSCANFNSSINFTSLSAFNSSFSSFNESTSIDFDFLSPDTSEKKKHTDHGLTSLSLLVQIEDIVPENVIISISNNNSHGISCDATNITASEVNIKPTSSKPSDNFETQQLSQRSACFALGKILFEIFSLGDPFLMIDLGYIDENENDRSFSDLLVDENDASSFPASKRTSLSSGASSTAKYMKAKASLQERGLPRSICQLVSDLLEAEEGNSYISDTAIVLLEDAQFDLMRINKHPQRFLHDHTCPIKALESASLFHQTDGELYGRDKELGILMDAAARVSLHAPSLVCGTADMNSKEKHPGVLQVDDFLCEAVFLSGHSGSGKSSIIKKLVSSCNASDWFVLQMKFDRQVAPLSVLFQSLDAFFEYFVRSQREPSVQESFERISRSILTSIDNECLSQLCELLPNLQKLFLLANLQNDTAGDPLAIFTNSVGSGSNRLSYIGCSLFKAVCSGGSGGNCP